MKNVYVLAFVALLAIYFILALSLPPDPQVLAKHNISATAAQLLNLTILVPIGLIYLTALYGFIRVKQYTYKVRDTKEGPYFKYISNGLMVLAFSLPINAITGSLASYLKHSSPHLLSDITIFRQYLVLSLAFTAIFFISKGAHGLYSTLKQNAVKKQPYLGLLGAIALASVYTWLIETQRINNPAGQPYYVPDLMVIITIAIPYVFVWCTGIWAAIQMHRYQLGVKGVIYKRAIDYLAKGIAVIILIFILLQFITTLSGLLNRLDLTPLLAVVYLLVALYAVGFGLIARGAKKLKLLEEA